MREQWSSRIGFVLATAGFSIGLGNIWRFPYLAVVSRWGWSGFRDETNRGAAGLVTVSGSWRPLIRFVIPVAVSLVLLGAFGVGTGNPVVFLGWSSVVIALHVVLFLRRAPD